MTGPVRRNKVMMTEAQAAGLVRDGMTVSLGSGYPLAVTRAIIRSGARDLTVIANAGGWDLDLMIGAGCVKKVIGYYFGGGLEVIGPFFRRAAQRAEVEVWEVDEGMLLTGLRAAAQMLPFLPWRGGLGTDFPRINPDLKTFTDPVDGQTLLAVPAIKPDIAFIRAAEADEYGNARFHGPDFTDTAHHRAADVTVVQAERIVSNEEIRRFPERTAVSHAAGVVAAPMGSHPMGSPGFYIEDREHLTEYKTAARAAVRDNDPESFKRYLERYVLGPENHLDYLDAMSAKRLFSLYR